MNPAFGMGFGNPTTSAPAFGATTGTTFGFGTGAGTATGNTGFSFGPSTTTATPANTGFSFGLPASSAAPNTGFSFGGAASTAPSSAPFSFGGIAPTTTTAPTFNFGGLGANTSTTQSGFSFNQANTLGGGGLFSTGMGTMAPTAQGVMGTAMANNNLTNIAAALTCPIVYGDERDAILTKWNQLQAFWGTGKGYFSSSAPPVDFTAENPFCRFKAIGYSCMPTAKAEDGLVGVIFNKKEEEIRNQQQQVVDFLHRCFGSKPTISICVDAVKGFPDNKTEVVLYLLERAPTGTSRRIPALEICAYLEQPTVKSQITNLGIINIIPKTALSKEQLQNYLDSPPAGIDPFLWQQGKLDNPDPERLIPVPLVGFSDLHRRMKHQENQTKQHQERLDIIADDIAELNRRHATTVAKIAENKRKLIELQHRVLKTLVQQEVFRKMGFSIQADEEQLRTKLEAIQAELSAPTQFKGHLKELISQIRMQNYQASSSLDGERYTMDEFAKEKIKEHLRLQQIGITHLISIIKEDVVDLKTIEDVSKEVIDRRR